MYKKKLLILFLLSFFLVSCGVSIFSVFSPQGSEGVENADVLVELGQAKLREGDYEGAYKAFDKALSLDPKNSYALEGICTAYMLKKFDYNDFLNMLTKGGSTNFAPYIGKLYDVSKFTYDRLLKIINGEADGKIKRDDVNVNFSFFIFGTFYSTFFIADTDGDTNIVEDSDDLIFISNDLGMTFQTGKFTNDILSSIKLFKTLSGNKTLFDRMFDNVIISKNNLYNNFETEEVKSQISNIGESLSDIKKRIDEALVDLGVNTNNNTLSLTAMLSNTGITNVNINETTNLVLLYLTNSGITNYTLLTNLLVNNGFTNLSGTADIEIFIDDFTNVFTDTASVADDTYDVLTNYYQGQ